MKRKYSRGESCGTYKKRDMQPSGAEFPRVFDSYIKEKSSQAASGLDFFVNLIVALYSIMWYYIDISYIEVVL